MTNEIIKGLAEALKPLFGNTCRIYPDEMPQGLNPPCILISEAGVSQTGFHTTRKKKNRIYVLQYFPVSEAEALTECRQAAEEIMNQLDAIHAGDTLLRCSDIQCNIDREQRVANITLNVNTVSWQSTPGDTMAGFSTEVKTRKE